MNDDLNFKLSAASRKDRSENPDRQEESLDLVMSEKGLVSAESQRRLSSEKEIDDIIGQFSGMTTQDLTEAEETPEVEEIPVYEELPQEVEETPVYEELPPVVEETPVYEELPPEVEEIPVYEELPPDVEETPEQVELPEVEELPEAEELPEIDETPAEDSAQETPSDKMLDSLAFDSLKGKYDFINLSILTVLVVFIGLTFVFMKQTRDENKTKFSIKTLSSGEYSSYITEQYNSDLPMEKLMTQAEVVIKHLFGASDLEFVDYSTKEPPDGPVDDDTADDMAIADDPVSSETVTTTLPETTTSSGTTGKIPQSFDVSKADDPAESGDNVFTGRPIKTTTSRVTTTLELPKGTEDTTTKEVIFDYP